jgi:hypothetical protein
MEFRTDTITSDQGVRVFFIFSVIIERPMKKRCRILPAGGLGVSPCFGSPPRLGDIGG